MNVSALIDILEEENRVYSDMLELSQNKTNIIIQGKVAELENIVKVEQSMVLQMGRLEGQRDVIVEKICLDLKLRSEDTTISEVVKYLEPDQVEILESIQEKLGYTLTKLKSSNELNSKLIKNSLEFINFSMNLISNVDVCSNNYGNDGQVGDAKKRTFFDVKL